MVLSRKVCANCYFRSACFHVNKPNKRCYSSNSGFIGLSRERGLELFCPKDFHHFNGVDVCLEICKKKVCSVFKSLVSLCLRVERGTSDMSNGLND